MCKVYGYCRISRKSQNIERQERNILAAYPNAIIVKEAFTGTKIEGRKEFERLLKVVRPQDTIVFDSVSRMSRNADEGFSEYKRLFEDGVELVFLKEPYVNSATFKEAAQKQIEIARTGDAATDELLTAITSAINLYMLRLAEKQVKLAFEQSEKEVADLHQRTAEGIETARRAGKQIGQRQGAKLTHKSEAPNKELIRRYSKDFDGSLNDGECMKLIGIARNTYYKYKREMREDA